MTKQSVLTALLANVNKAIRDKSTLKVGGGTFDAHELVFLADALQAQLDVGMTGSSDRPAVPNAGDYLPDIAFQPVVTSKRPRKLHYWTAG